MAELRDDLLPDLKSISDYTGEPIRRLRWLIASHGFPARKIGGKWQSRKSWLEKYYAEPQTCRTGQERAV